MKNNNVLSAPLVSTDHDAYRYTHTHKNCNVKNMTHSKTKVKKTIKITTLMSKNKTLLPILAALTITSLSAMSHAAAVEFTSQDWQVACDNTRTCRLAGYQAENNSELPVSVLLIRRAGANASVDGQVKFGGAKESSAKALMQLGNRHRISLFIDGKDRSG